MGTVVTFEVAVDAVGTNRVHEAVRRACDELHHVDEVFSTFRPESPVSRIRTGVLNLEDAPDEVKDAERLCELAREFTDGLFDAHGLPEGFDPSGLVKGWAIERALWILAAHDIPSAIVNGGGDVALLGRPPAGERWRIGIRHPWRPDSLAAVVLADSAVATSGTYERGAHLVDPRNGVPALAVASASVVGPSLTLADALATALAVGGPDSLDLVERIDGYEAYLITVAGEEHHTRGLEFD